MELFCLLGFFQFPLFLLFSSSTEINEMGRVVKLGWLQVDAIGKKQGVDREKGGMEGFHFVSDVEMRIKVRTKNKGEESKINSCLSFCIRIMARSL